jgi:hypothetical protein
MLSRMVLSLPPEMRTLHLLKTPDILCANDRGHGSVYRGVIDELPVDELPNGDSGGIAEH